MLLASSRASPARDRPTAHESARALAHRARRAAPPTRHSRYPAASDADEKPLPCAVTAVPPSASARAGTSQLAADAGWYVKRAAPPAPPPAAPYCRAFTESDTRAAPRPRAADAHSSCAPSTRRASTAPEPLPIRQRTVDASRNSAPSIATATRVPPRSGPSGGATPFARTLPMKKEALFPICPVPWNIETAAQPIPAAAGLVHIITFSLTTDSRPRLMPT